MKVSFIIPSYNCATWLPQTVQSCFDQTHKDIEIIIIDDGSTDTTQMYLDWLKKQNIKNIRIYNNETNLGRSATRNKGNDLATGDIICILDSDDLATTKRAEITVNKFKELKCKFLYGSAIMVGATGNLLKNMDVDVFNLDEALKRHSNKIVHSTVAYTKEIAKKYPYRDGLACSLGVDDWTQQIEIASAGITLEYVPQVLCAYRGLLTAITATRDVEEVEKYKTNFIEGLKCKI